MAMGVPPTFLPCGATMADTEGVHGQGHTLHLLTLWGNNGRYSSCTWPGAYPPPSYPVGQQWQIQQLYMARGIPSTFLPCGATPADTAVVHGHGHTLHLLTLWGNNGRYSSCTWPGAYPPPSYPVGQQWQIQQLYMARGIPSTFLPCGATMADTAVVHGQGHTLHLLTPWGNNGRYSSCTWPGVYPPPSYPMGQQWQIQQLYMARGIPSTFLPRGATMADIAVVHGQGCTLHLLTLWGNNGRYSSCTWPGAYPPPSYPVGQQWQIQKVYMARGVPSTFLPCGASMADTAVVHGHGRTLHLLTLWGNNGRYRRCTWPWAYPPPSYPVGQQWQIQKVYMARGIHSTFLPCGATMADTAVVHGQGHTLHLLTLWGNNGRYRRCTWPGAYTPPSYPVGQQWQIQQLYMVRGIHSTFLPCGATMADTKVVHAYPPPSYPVGQQWQIQQLYIARGVPSTFLPCGATMADTAVVHGQGHTLHLLTLWGNNGRYSSCTWPGAYTPPSYPMGHQWQIQKLYMARGVPSTFLPCGATMADTAVVHGQGRTLHLLTLWGNNGRYRSCTWPGAYTPPSYPVGQQWQIQKLYMARGIHSTFLPCGATMADTEGVHGQGRTLHLLTLWGNNGRYRRCTWPGAYPPPSYPVGQQWQIQQLYMASGVHSTFLPCGATMADTAVVHGQGHTPTFLPSGATPADTVHKKTCCLTLYCTYSWLLQSMLQNSYSKQLI